MGQKKLKYIIARSRDAGVCAGYLKSQSKDGRQLVLVESRRLWYWKGSASLHELANKGVGYPQECKFPAVLLGDHQLTEVCEVLSVTKEAQASIASVPVWSANPK